MLKMVTMNIALVDSYIHTPSNNLKNPHILMFLHRGLLTNSHRTVEEKRLVTQANTVRLPFLM